MQPNGKYLNLDLEFWANIKLLNQRLGYAERKSKLNPSPGFVIPTVAQIEKVFKAENLNVTKLVEKGVLTKYGKVIVDYMAYRSEVLITNVEPNLMKLKNASDLYKKLKKQIKPTCPLPMNKQSGAKKTNAYLSCMVNMIIEKNLNGKPCDYDPKELTALTNDDFPVRTLSRRVDGAYPSIKDPIAIWEIKEYYYTTTFGSRVADGVYETQLDGWELKEAKDQLGKEILHYLIIDDYHTWWEQGKSYLCRLVDSMHMGLVTEVLFGKEIEERLPILVKGWTKQTKSRSKIKNIKEL